MVGKLGLTSGLAGLRSDHDVLVALAVELAGATMLKECSPAVFTSWSIARRRENVSKTERTFSKSARGVSNTRADSQKYHVRSAPTAAIAKYRAPVSL